MRKIVIALLFLSCAFMGADAKNQTYVVLVGLSKYKHPKDITPLPGFDQAVRDAANFFYKQNRGRVFMLLDENATTDHIKRVMKTEFAKADKDDIIIFVYAGHGHEYGVTTYDVGDAKNYGIYYDDIQSIMRGCKASRKIMFINSCHSGGAKAKNPNTKTNDQRQTYRRQPTKTEVMIYMSSRADELTWGNIFLSYVISGLEGRADTNNDHKVTARELFNYVNPNVLAETRSCVNCSLQHPQMWGRFDNNMVVSYIK